MPICSRRINGEGEDIGAVRADNDRLMIEEEDDEDGALGVAVEAERRGLRRATGGGGRGCVAADAERRTLVTCALSLSPPFASAFGTAGSHTRSCWSHFGRLMSKCPVTRPTRGRGVGRG